MEWLFILGTKIGKKKKSKDWEWGENVKTKIVFLPKTYPLPRNLKKKKKVA